MRVASCSLYTSRQCVLWPSNQITQIVNVTRLLEGIGVANSTSDWLKQTISLPSIFLLKMKSEAIFSENSHCRVYYILEVYKYNICCIVTINEIFYRFFVKNIDFFQVHTDFMSCNCVFQHILFCAQAHCIALTKQENLTGNKNLKP